MLREARELAERAKEFWPKYWADKMATFTTDSNQNAFVFAEAFAASEVARERERAVQFLRAGILAMTGRARIKWADGVRDYLIELEREVKS